MLTLSVATLHDISIHTSAREVTVFTERSVTDEIDFNPHFRKGSDIYRSELCYRKSHFNPHFRKGSDGTMLLLRVQLIISIHTSAREVTAVSVYMAGFSPISIHTSAREVTYGLRDHSEEAHIFQSTLPQGKWPHPLVSSKVPSSFQSTLPQGKWQKLQQRML